MCWPSSPSSLRKGQTAANTKTQAQSRLRTLLQWAADNGHAGYQRGQRRHHQGPRRRLRTSASPSTFRRSMRSSAARFTPMGTAPRRAGVKPRTGYHCWHYSRARGWRSLASFGLRDVVSLSYPDPDGAEQQGWFLHLVETDGEDGTKLKNAASERLVPVHPELERRGLRRLRSGHEGPEATTGCSIC